MKNRGIKAILFDIDGVLFNSVYANTIFYKSLLEGFGYKVPRWPKMKRLSNTCVANDVIRIASRERSKAKLKRLYKAQLTYPFPKEKVKPVKYVNTTLSRLRTRYKLGIVTGNDKEGIADLFGVADLGRYFTMVVMVGDYKRPKPFPDPILIALKRLRLAPNEVIYIGDTDIDKKAAKSAGVGFIGYDEFSKGFFGKGDRVAHSMPDLLKKIDELSGG
jgi:HAD superfamily hydrolase (TIGR01509 family)